MNKKYLIVITLTIITSIAIFKVHNIEPLINKKLFSFPMEIDQWTGRKITMESWVFKSLDTSYAILRDYRSPDGDIVNLAITWYDDREVAFHAPEACLGGVGDKVKEKTVYPILFEKDQNHQIGKLLVERNGQRSLVLYYFVNDGYVTPSQTELRIRVLLKRLRFKRTSAAFVRLMMPITKSREITRGILETYLKQTLPIIKEYTATPKH